MLNGFIIGSITNADAVENETVDPQTSDYVNSFGRSAVDKNSAIHDQVIDRKICDRLRKEFFNAVMAVEKRVHNAITPF